MSNYELGAELGRGAFGTVYRCVDRDTGVAWAAKVLRKSQLRRRRTGRAGGDALDGVRREVAIWKRLCHAHVVALHEVLDDEAADELVLVSELVEGGVVGGAGSWGLASPAAGAGEGDGAQTEHAGDGAPSPAPCPAPPLALVRVWAAQLLDGVAYLHHQRVVHRDLKPANLLVARGSGWEPSGAGAGGGAGTLKIADFGVSQVWCDGPQADALRSTAGTPAFLAPEMLTGAPFGGRAADMWAAGMTLHALLHGAPAFVGPTLPATYELIRSAPLPWPELAEVRRAAAAVAAAEGGGVAGREHAVAAARAELGRVTALSDLARDLVRRLLERDPAARMGVEAARAHAFLEGRGCGEPAQLPPRIRVGQGDIDAAIRQVVPFRTAAGVARVGGRLRARVAARKRAAALAGGAQPPQPEGGELEAGSSGLSHGDAEGA